MGFLTVLLFLLNCKIFFEITRFTKLHRLHRTRKVLRGESTKKPVLYKSSQYRDYHVTNFKKKKPLYTKISF